MKIVHTDDAPAALGPYSQAIALDDWLFTSGQVGIDPATGELMNDSFETEARQVLANLGRVLNAADCGFGDVIKATVYLTNMTDFNQLNALYESAMDGHRPARSTVQVAALPKGARVEIDLVARRPGR